MNVTLSLPPAPSSGPRGARACSVLGVSPDRRSRAAKFIREGFFRGPMELKVGAVVMISGAAVPTCQCRESETGGPRAGAQRHHAQCERGRGKGQRTARHGRGLLCSRVQLRLRGELGVRRIAEPQHGEAPAFLRVVGGGEGGGTSVGGLGGRGGGVGRGDRDAVAGEVGRGGGDAGGREVLCYRRQCGQLGGGLGPGGRLLLRGHSETVEERVAPYVGLATHVAAASEERHG